MNQHSSEETFRLRDQRLQKLQQLEEHFGIDPYLLNLEDKETLSSLPAWQQFKKERISAEDFHQRFAELASASEQEDTLVWVAGRIHSERNSGMFLDIHDQSGKVQIVNEREQLGPDYQRGELHFLDLLDKGDILAVQGIPYRTPRGELSVKARQLWLLAKALQPPPEIIEKKRRRLGLQDVEVRYRQRYLDLMVNPEARALFRCRARILSELRWELDQRGFLEFETPILQVEAGGANARPFITHHNALNIDLYLRVATELHLKRLLVGGFERVYEIGRIFRNEGISTRHNPEFTSVEIYQAFADYEDVLQLTEAMIVGLQQKLGGALQIDYGERTIDLSPPWSRHQMVDLVEQITGVRFQEMSLEEAKQQAQKLKVELNPQTASLGAVLSQVFEARCEEQLIQPTFVLGYPWENSPLAGNCPATGLRPVSQYRGSAQAKANYAHRFELFIAGQEIANGFAEQNDPRRQQAAFEAQLKNKQAGDLEAHPLDEDFVKALEFAMPPAGGVGIGIDRLVMLLTNSPSIREVILFPTMKPLM